jgi:hypothetical protein
MSAPPAESPGGHATRSSSKRTSSSPQSMENAKRLALALVQTPAPAVPGITPTDEDMDWEKANEVPAKQPPAPAPNLAPAPALSPPAKATDKNEDNNASVETMYSDYQTDELKPATKTTVIGHAANQLEHDDKEDGEEEDEDDKDVGPGDDFTKHRTKYEIPKNTKPNSLCRCMVDHLEHNGAPDLATGAAKCIETWTAVLQNEDHLLTSLGKMSGPPAQHPVLFLALNADTSTVLMLHHSDVLDFCNTRQALTKNSKVRQAHFERK